VAKIVVEGTVGLEVRGLFVCLEIVLSTVFIIRIQK
jgi:hypothetical protein